MLEKQYDEVLSFSFFPSEPIFGEVFWKWKNDFETRPNFRNYENANEPEIPFERVTETSGEKGKLFHKKAKWFSEEIFGGW